MTRSTCRLCQGRGCQYCYSRPSAARFPGRLTEAEKLITAWYDTDFFTRENRELFNGLRTPDGIRAIEAAVQYGRKNPGLRDDPATCLPSSSDRWACIEVGDEIMSRDIKPATGE